MEGVDWEGLGQGLLLIIIDSSFHLAPASCVAILSASLSIDLILFLLKPE